MSQAWWIPLLLVALAAVTRRPSRDRWAWGIDLALAVVSGLVAASASRWLSAFHLTGGVWTVTDLHEYCGTVASMAGGGPGMSHQRSKLAGWLASVLAASRGVLGALGAAAMVHVGVAGAALYLWGRAIHGRTAGLCVVLCALSLAPFVVASRDLRFYPAFMAAFAVGAAGTALALRYRSLPALLFAGAGVGLCLLADLRGLTYGLAFGGLGLVAVLWAHPKRWPLRLSCFALPINGAWWLGRWAYGDTTSPLEGQVDIHQRLVLRGHELDWTMRDLPEAAYIFGHTAVSGIPATLRNLLVQSSLVPRSYWDHPAHWQAVEAHLQPWLWPVCLGLLLAVLACLRGPDRWLRLLAMATILPFAMGLRGSLLLDSLGSHYLALHSPAVALCLGLGLGGLATLVPGGTSGPAWLRGGLVLGLVASLVGGVLPSPASPEASWRTPVTASNHGLARLLESHEGGRSVDVKTAPCLARIARDEQQGLDLSDFKPAGKRGARGRPR